MPAPFATENKRFSNTVKAELWPNHAYCREVVVANEATAKEYVIGAVLGMVTATSKYRIVEATASDGSQNAAAVVLEDKTVPATTDTRVLVLFRGPAIVSKDALSFGASVDTQPERNAIYAALVAKGIIVADAV
jgi:hypothetical protein